MNKEELKKRFDGISIKTALFALMILTPMLLKGQSISVELGARGWLQQNSEFVTGPDTGIRLHSTLINNDISLLAFVSGSYNAVYFEREPTFRGIHFETGLGLQADYLFTNVAIGQLTAMEGSNTNPFTGALEIGMRLPVSNRFTLSISGEGGFTNRAFVTDSNKLFTGAKIGITWNNLMRGEN